MKETSPDGPYIDRLRSWASSKVHGGNRSTARGPGPQHDPSLLPISSDPTRSTTHSSSQGSATRAAVSLPSSSIGINGGASDNGILLPGLAHDTLHSAGYETSKRHRGSTSSSSQNAGSHIDPQAGSQPSSSTQAARKGSQLRTKGPAESNEKTQADPAGPQGPEAQEADKGSIVTRFIATSRKILLHSWLNVLLIFVPVGIAVEFVPNVSPTVVFTMNAIAIIPLAGLLSHATETVAHRMGDAIGALLNITFGNAVELIIFIVALVKNEIAIVQASLLGSILANLLLILGMCFLLGGLRFREQIYNSTVTQMSACLLSLSVISLVLPTAFHASFSDTTLADEKSLVISRGTSIILLLVYLIYLVFQLKSHAYMYESTPQELIDAEATPGPAVAWFDSSSSDDSSSSSSDSDSSGQSRETMTKRMKRMVRHPRRRKSSMASMDTMDTTNTLRTRPSHASPTTEISLDTENGPSTELGHQASPLFASRTNSNEDADSSTDGDRRRRLRRKYKSSHRRNKKQLKKLHSHSQGATSPPGETIAEVPEFGEKNISGPGEPRRVDFAVNADNAGQSQVAAQSGEGITSKRPFDALLALKPVAKNLTPTVFAQQLNTTGMPVIPSGPVPRVRYGIRRTNSLPGRLNEHLIRAPGAMLPPQLSAHAIATATGTAKPDDLHADDLSRVSALLLLLISTGLVAVCAEFMVDSINGLVETSNVSELFIGLIVLPIVGNAAEHVTAITVAMKNKMDLAIGVAVGSSIQIALFMTPLVVIIGWCMQREMTLYFTLFETVCLFVSAFIANFLVLDGRSNYLEGALLCATYVIIGLVSFFYPNN